VNEEVRETPELARILSLPRRRTDDPQWATLADDMTSLLKRPEGTMRLRPAQAMALHDIGTCRGGFCPMGVGEGKTLTTLIAAYVLDAKRPILMEPAALIQKTVRDREVLAKHWFIPTNVRLFSYEMLGRVQAAHELDVYKPDLFICDEVHKLKNRDAAVTRRIARYMAENPDTMFVALSGTIMRKSVRDFAHILRWCLKENAPIPKTDVEVDEWANALDEKVDELRRWEPGALLDFCTPDDIAKDPPIVAARRGFQRRLIETPGVVATVGDGERVDCSIYVKAITYAVKPITEQHFAKLRTEWLTPDDWQLMQAVDIWRHARELALGFHYIWDPRPPEDWRRARREWAAFVREVLSRSRTLDSELDVANAVDAGKLPNDTLQAWRAIRDTFTPNTVAVWHDDSALKVCIDWAKKPGIIWTEHALFAERLAQLSGLKYYGAKGLDADGSFIDDADPKRAAIVSLDANREGRNLQNKWARNLVVSPPEGSDVWQQFIARTHRPGQMADEVEVDVFIGCIEHANAWRKALAGAAAVRDTTGAEQKLLLADIDGAWPSEMEIATYTGSRWRKAAYENSGAKAA
jgi:hypothetical protein